jgi:hypothetical protein
METATETTWSGWWRKNPWEAWRRVVSGCSDSAEAWTELLGRELPSGDLQVTKGDQETATETTWLKVGWRTWRCRVLQSQPAAGGLRASVGTGGETP